MNAWEIVPFEAFNRQSRVAINVQRDLEDMLTKLERPHEGPTEQEEAKRLLKNRRKRKFLELAVPVGVVAVLCLAFCLLHLVETGGDIVNNRKVNAYFQHLQDLELCVSTVVQELSSRKEHIQSKRKSEEYLDEAYDATDKVLYKILPGETKQEWQITEKLYEHRHHVTKDKNVITDGIFYSEFIQEVLNFGLKVVNDIEELPMWKKNYDHNKLTRQIYSIKPTLIVINYTCSQMGLRASNSLYSDFDLVTFLEYAGHHLNKMKLNDSSETSEFLRNTEAIFGQISLTDISGPSNNLLPIHSTNNICNMTLVKLSELLSYKVKRRDIIFKTLTGLNSSSIKGYILIFCCILVCMFLTAVCAVLFGYLLRYECKVSIGVTDWLEKVMKEVTEIDLYRELVLKKICPRIIRDEFDPNNQSTMIPYYVPEATMAMLSIAHFSSFFQQFTASQTVQILSFVMDLFDERMSQYNVFPVTKFGDEQIVVSDTIHRRDGQHACVIANMALDIMSCCNDIEVGNGGGSKLQLKIGIHSGPCVGMLYIRKGEISFRMTGSSVQVLRKLHRLSTPNRIQVTDSTHRLLSKSETYSLNCRGHMDVKGISQHSIYWLNGRKVSVSAFQDMESQCSRVGSWFELEKKPLYRLDEVEGGYTPIDKCYRPRQFSIASHLSMESSMETGRHIGSQGPSSGEI